MAWDDVFNINPEFTFDVTNKYGVVTSNYESARIHRRAIYPDVLRVFKLQWNNADKTTKDNIVTFFNDTQGGCLPLKWTPPNEAVQIRVKFVSDSLKWNMETGVLFKISFMFEELFKGNLY